jgi:hypothetical protein
VTHFEAVIREFQKRRVEKEIYADQVREERFRELMELACDADQQLRQRRRRRKNSVGRPLL